MKIELNTELSNSKMLLENESYKVQINELELDGRYLFIRGIVLDVDKKEASEFEDSIDMSDFCYSDNESDNEIDEPDTSEDDEQTS
jgi:hypothetical protein